MRVRLCLRVCAVCVGVCMYPPAQEGGPVGPSAAAMRCAQGRLHRSIAITLHPDPIAWGAHRMLGAIGTNQPTASQTIGSGCSVCCYAPVPAAFGTTHCDHRSRIALCGRAHWGPPVPVGTHTHIHTHTHTRAQRRHNGRLGQHMDRRKTSIISQTRASTSFTPRSHPSRCSSCPRACASRSAAATTS